MTTGRMAAPARKTVDLESCNAISCPPYPKPTEAVAEQATLDPAPVRSPISALHVRDSLPASVRGTVRSGRHVLSPASVAARATPVPTSVETLDRLLSGGLPRGHLVELIGTRSSGRFSTLLAALAAATRCGELAALIDLGDSLDPRTAAEAGIGLERLLWIRPKHLKQAMISTELVLHAGFTLVGLDLGTPPVPGGRGPEAGWLRLARTATERRAALFLSSPYRVSHTAATTVIASHRLRPLWRRHGSSPRLLDGLVGDLRLEKSRLAHRTGSASFHFITPEGRLLSQLSPSLSNDHANASPQRLLAAR